MVEEIVNKLKNIETITYLTVQTFNSICIDLIYSIYN